MGNFTFHESHFSSFLMVLIFGWVDYIVGAWKCNTDQFPHNPKIFFFQLNILHCLSATLREWDWEIGWKGLRGTVVFFVLILPIMSYSFLISFFNTSSPFARHYFVGINLLVTMSAVNMHKVLQCISSHYVTVIFCFSLLCVQCCCLNTNSIGALSI